MTLHGEWLILAEHVLEDCLTRNLTLVSCLERAAATEFPALHHGFAVVARFRWVAEPPHRPTAVLFRLLRLSEHDGAEVLLETRHRWQPEARVANITARFQVLRLLRPEVVVFRMDARVGRGPWIEGPAAALDVVRLEPEPLAGPERDPQGPGPLTPGGP